MGYRPQEYVYPPRKRRHTMHLCPTCGEFYAPKGQRCKRCTASMEIERLERESGR